MELKRNLKRHDVITLKTSTFFHVLGWAHSSVVFRALPHHRVTNISSVLLMLEKINRVSWSAFLGCYAASSGNSLPTFLTEYGTRQVVPKRQQEITITRCIIPHKETVFIYFAMEARTCVVTHLYMKTLTQSHILYSEVEFLVSVCLFIQSFPYLTMSA